MTFKLFFGNRSVVAPGFALPVSLATAAPVIAAASMGVIYALTATPVAAGAPTFTAPALACTANLAANAIAVTPPSLGAPSLVPIVLLVASNLATAPPVEAAAPIGLTHVLIATAVALSAPSLGTTSLVEVFPDLVLGDRVIDYGLAALAEADKILACTYTPMSYAQAIALAVGEDAATFGAPSGGTVSSLAVTGGTVTGTGTVRRWAAVDTVNARLLAHGDLTGDANVFPGMAWTLQPITIVQPGVP